MSHAPTPHYLHRAKDAAPGPVSLVGAAVLKWYDLHEPAHRISPDTRSLARTALRDFGASLTRDQAGFVILHQCSANFAFLLIGLWRGNNELWQSVLYIDTPLTDFAPFAPAYPAPPNLRPTFCVWELGIVAHEAEAWQRYLTSDRTAADLELWQTDNFHGTV